MSGAIRMVAYGVLEYSPVPMGNQTIDRFIEREHKSAEVLQLVKDEVAAYGWLLKRALNRRGKDSMKSFILLGRLNKTAALQVRPTIAEGTLQDVCIVAARMLDQAENLNET